jgi:hypothetical protein
MGEKLEPREAIAVITAVVVALDADGRDARVGQPLQSALRLHQRPRVD